jgi:hypothetical protein
MRASFVNSGIFYVALGLFAIFQGLKIVFTTGLQYGPGQYLAIIGALILVVGLVHYVQNIRKARNGEAASSKLNKTEKEDEPVPDLPKGVAHCFEVKLNLGGRSIKIGPAVFAFALFILYTALTDWIGYVISTMIFLLSTMLLFGERIWWKIALTATAATVLFWAVFVKIARLSL